ncbi:MAG: ATP-binding cassette domain-containing protein [Clostridia bacterium]|nr:ATP-binding cassette domain-containing protein [Clostridia bacterium]
MMDINALTISAYVLLFSYRSNFSDLIWYVGSAFKNLSEIEVSLSRMFSLYNENIYQSEKFGIKNIKNLKGKIEFRNIEYAYSEIEEVEQTKKQKQYSVKHIKQAPIFKNLSFVIEPNTTVAFVGKSGSGKSTILSLISKLNEVDKGKVLIDNVDIKKLSKKCLRDNISLINQFPYIFDMSIKENLKLVKKGATDEEIVEILDNACLTEDIAKMPKGVDTRVGETGVKLSGGQRQRLAIARALLKQTKIILFDESTSSLDNFAQSHIQQSIDKLKGKQTVVIVAHRLSTIKNVDKIYFLENGQITDSGTFNELFNKNENFKKMFLVENM